MGVKPRAFAETQRLRPRRRAQSPSLQKMVAFAFDKRTRVNPVEDGTSGC